MLIGWFSLSLSLAQSLTATERQQVIDGSLNLLQQRYVFPDVARKMADAVRRKAHDYARIADARQFASQLTADLQAVSQDRHLHVDYSAQALPVAASDDGQPSEAAQEGMRRRLTRDNFGITGVEVLPGNVGYVKFRFLASAQWAGNTYAALMNYLAHTDALILDLRYCRGSMPDAIPLLASYFFDDPVHLVSFYDRPANTTTQSWTYAYVPGKRYLNKPLYVLTSRGTFSGGEELAYDLKNLKRATLIGEVTGGGANPGGPVLINDHFSIWVPIGRAISPVTNTNWEGVGVRPDSVVSAPLARHKAHLMALDYLIQQATADPTWQQQLRTERLTVEQQPPRLVRHTFRLNGFAEAQQVTVAGTFNNWHPRMHPLTRTADGWQTELELEPSTHMYKFIVDGKWITDPANPLTRQEGSNANSVLTLLLKQ